MVKLTSGKDSSTLTISSVRPVGVCSAVSSSKMPLRSLRIPTAWPLVNSTLSLPLKQLHWIWLDLLAVKKAKRQCCCLSDIKKTFKTFIVKDSQPQATSCNVSLYQILIRIYMYDHQNPEYVFGFQSKYQHEAESGCHGLSPSDIIKVALITF